LQAERQGDSLSRMIPPPQASQAGFFSAPVAAMLLGVLVLAVGVAAIPADQTLGAATRWVFVHGAITWTGIIMTMAAGVVALRLLLSKGSDASGTRLGTALRRLESLALLFWAGSLALSFPVMKMSWGGVLWSEPRLLMSVEVVFILLVVWVVGLVFANRRVLALATLGAAAAVVALMLSTSGAFHPDNPIFRSGSPRFIGSFLALLAGMVLLSTGVTLLEPRGVRPCT
jgi:hypothetical protein